MPAAVDFEEGDLGKAHELVDFWQAAASSAGSSRIPASMLSSASASFHCTTRRWPASWKRGPARRSVAWRWCCCSISFRAIASGVRRGPTPAIPRPVLSPRPRLRQASIARSTGSSGVLPSLPFAHSEDLIDQDRSVTLHRTLDPEQTEYAEGHRDIIRRFGRFPHRNAVLEREYAAEDTTLPRRRRLHGVKG